MNKVLSFLLALAVLLVLPANSFALPSQANVEFRANHGVSGGSPGVLLGYQLVSNKRQLLKCLYDFSKAGGAISVITLKAVDGSNCTLPSGAIVMGGIIDVLTAPLSGGSATIAVGTGQAGNDLHVALGVASFTGRLDIVPANTAATAIKLTADRIPTMTIAAATLTTGKFNVFIEYLLSN